MNSVNLIGRITHEPEIKQSTSGKSYLRFSIAVDKKLTKEKREEFIQRNMSVTDYPRIVTWGKRAENCNKYLCKGSLVGISGSISTDSYERDDGTKAYTMEIIADKVKFLDNRKASNEENNFEEVEVNDDIPF